MGRIISKEARIGVDTLPEIKVAAKSCAGELGRKIKLNGQALSLQGLMNALILDFIDRPRDEQFRSIAVAVERLNELQALDDDFSRILPTHRRIESTSDGRNETADFTLEPLPPEEDAPPPHSSTPKNGRRRKTG